jgi:hypothetical protein
MPAPSVTPGLVVVSQNLVPGPKLSSSCTADEFDPLIAIVLNPTAESTARRACVNDSQR